MSSPVGLVSTTVSRSRSLSIRSARARSINAAPATTTSEADNGRSTKRPCVSSSNSSVISSTKLNIAAPLPDRREGGRGIWLDRKDRIEAADRKHLAHIGREAEQRHLALGLLHLFGHHQQDPQPGAADIVELCHIDGQLRAIAFQDRVQPV